MQDQLNPEVHLTLPSSHSPFCSQYSSQGKLFSRLHTLCLSYVGVLKLAVSPDCPISWSHCHLTFFRVVITVWKYLVRVFTFLSPSAGLSTPQRKDMTLFVPCSVLSTWHRAEGSQYISVEWMNDWREGSSHLKLPEVLVRSSEEYNWKTSPCITDDDENLPIVGFGASSSASSCLTFLIWKTMHIS